MSTSHEIIQTLTAQGIRLGVKGEKLWAEGPVHLLTEDLRTTLARNKLEILAVLRAGTVLEQMTYQEAQVHFEELGYLYELEEKAALLQYDGGLDRDRAEQQAVAEMVRRMTGYEQKTNN